MRRSLVLGVVLLLIIVSIIPSLPSEQLTIGDIIIVDDEGDGDYTSIKEALANANPGDTIEVYSGTYYERGIDIVKEGITLQGIPFELGNGSDTGKPFIDGEGKNYVFLFDAENITLDSFHIENKDGTAHDILDLSRNADGCTVSNNDLSNTTICFIFVRGSNNKIINNNISHSIMRQGICLCDPSSNNIVTGNVISDCKDGILLWDSPYNLIMGNTIRNCPRFGIDNTFSHNTIMNNTLEDNGVGFQIYYGEHNTITHNNFINNQRHAQYLYSQFKTCLTNKWSGNYWGRPRILPYPILGQVFLFPWVQFDWRPAREPYDITQVSEL